MDDGIESSSPLRLLCFHILVIVHKSTLLPDILRTHTAVALMIHTNLCLGQLRVNKYLHRWASQQLSSELNNSTKGCGFLAETTKIFASTASAPRLGGLDSACLIR